MLRDRGLGHSHCWLRLRHGHLDLEDLSRLEAVRDLHLHDAGRRLHLQQHAAHHALRDLELHRLKLKLCGGHRLCHRRLARSAWVAGRSWVASAVRVHGVGWARGMSVLSRRAQRGERRVGLFFWWGSV